MRGKKYRGLSGAALAPPNTIIRGKLINIKLAEESFLRQASRSSWRLRSRGADMCKAQQLHGPTATKSRRLNMSAELLNENTFGGWGIHEALAAVNALGPNLSDVSDQSIKRAFYLLCYLRMHQRRAGARGVQETTAIA